MFKYSSKNFYLVPDSIKIYSNQKKTRDSKNYLKLSSTLQFSNIKVLVINGKNELFLDKIVNVNELKNWFKSSKSKNKKLIEDRIKNITKTKSLKTIFCDKNPIIMGILNITDNSFYDGGKFLSYKNAIKKAMDIHQLGADIIDIGGESTKPYSKSIDYNIEIKRVIPIIEYLADKGIIVSCDTRNSQTMKEALNAGAKIINDVSGFNYDKKTLSIISDSDCLYVINHSKGDPQNMQINPNYKCATIEVYDELFKKINLAKLAGISENRIIIDPGIGFGKLDKHNFEILKYLSLYRSLGCPILIGTSRKSLIGNSFNNFIEPEHRLPGSLALSIDSYMKGASILRVHDVYETIQAIKILQNANK